MHLKLYIWTIAISAITIISINFFFVQPNITLFFLMFWGFLGPIIIIGIDAIFATIVHLFPRKWMNPYKKCFYSSRKELSFYRKIHIVSWKDYIPDTGKLTTGLSKSKIEGTKKDYLYAFLEETCYAEWVHYAMSLCGFLMLIFTPKAIWYSMIIPQILVNFVLNIPPILIQRNNRPKLITMYEHNTSSK